MLWEQKKSSPFSFHFHEHHRASRKLQFRDPIYENPLFSEDGDTKEVFHLALLGIGHLPLLFISPGFLMGAAIGGLRYYYVHRKCHLDPEWCKEHYPWHYDHHMAPNQHIDGELLVSGSIRSWVPGSIILELKRLYETPKEDKHVFRPQTALLMQIIWRIIFRLSGAFQKRRFCHISIEKTDPLQLVA